MNHIRTLVLQVRRVTCLNTTLRATAPFNRNFGNDLTPPDDQNELEDAKTDLKSIPVPRYKPKNTNETLLAKRARLTWQSRKRGISENCLLLSTFADKYLSNFDEKRIQLFDSLINDCNNDWDLYYWMTGAKPVPEEFNNEIMDMLKIHCRNDEKTERFEQPSLNYEPVDKLAI